MVHSLRSALLLVFCTLAGLLATVAGQAQTPTPPASQTGTPTSQTSTVTALTLSPAASTVCVGSPALLTLSGCPTGGTIRWSTGQTTASVTVTPAQPSAYTATCTQNGVSSSAVATVTTVQAVTFTAGPGSITVCEGTSPELSVALADGTSGTLAWFGNNNPIRNNPTASTARLVLTTVQAWEEGNYTVTATNQCGVTTSRVARVTVIPSLTLVATSTPASCAGLFTGKIQIAATGGIGTRQYQLNGGPFQSLNSFISLPAGAYSVGVKDEFGCSAVTLVDVKQPATLALSLTAVSVKCTGGTDGGIIAAVTGGSAPYSYKVNGGTAQSSPILVDLKAGSYTVVVTDAGGCSASQTATVGAPPTFELKTVLSPTRCAGSADGAITVSATNGTAPFQYQLGTGAFQTGTLFTGLSAGTYELTARDARGCTIRQTATVQQPAILTLTGVSAPVNCFGAASGSVTVKATGGTEPIRYQLTSSKVVQRTPVFTGLAVGDYTVVATDTNGCTALVPVSVGKADPISVRASTLAARCCVCPTGVVSLTSTGGSGSARQFQRLGGGSQVSSQFGGLVPGQYRFRVTDEVGCADTVAALIADATAMTLTAGRIKDATCPGLTDGEAAVQLAGGTKPFSFFWQTPRRDTLRSRSGSQTGIGAGTYTVSVLDSNRCTTTTTFVTVQNQFPMTETPVVSQVGGTLRATNIPGLQWYVQTDTSAARAVPNATQATLTPYQSGRYYAIATQNGCPSPASNQITFVLTALSEPASGLSLAVVPNPVGAVLRLAIEQPDRQGVALALHDAGGRLVRTWQVPGFVGKKQVEWPLLDLPTGIYLLRAEAGTRQATLRVVKE
ncbi:T9SS type A sorting domain-containing protein [Spirosoma luteolum]